MRKNLNWSSVIIFMTFGFLLFSGMMYSNPSGAADMNGKKITLVCPRTKDSFLGKWLTMIYTDAFKRLGMELVFRHYPPKRCSLMVDKGMADGEIWRVRDYNTAHPNLIRVETSPFSNRFCAYAMNPDTKLDGWDSLKNTDYKVDYMRGQKKTDEELPKWVKKENLHMINHWTEGLRRLSDGRTDIYVNIEWTIEEGLRSDEFRNSGIRMAGVMEEVTSHSFLHKKHKELVPKLSDVLKQIKAEGLVEKYKAMAER